ncbi:hypothetical protein Tco_1572870 [Tanacetum coccineum]
MPIDSSIVGSNFDNIENDNVSVGMAEIRKNTVSSSRVLNSRPSSGMRGAACKSLACIRLCSRGQSCLRAPGTCRGPDVCDTRTSYVSRQRTSSDGDNAAPCLLRRLATPDWLHLTFWGD